jgi:oxygen-independent coproporphyrinogen III oxidase
MTGSATGKPGLYIHIPFCVSKCGYCDFYSVTLSARIPDFLDALHQEMSLYHRNGDSFDTVYVGGGTPSLLGRTDIERLFADIRRSFLITPVAEITFEANPADITPPLLEALRCSGVNRLSIGVQSFDDGILSFLGRRHNRSEALHAFEAARGAGFAHINIDLIYGIPGQTLPTWLDSLREAIALGPEHLSCYQLSVAAGTPIAKRCRSGEVCLPDDALQADFFFRTSETLHDAGYIHYEISNFAREGSESRHNSKYWNHTPYLGLGPSAHSFRDRERRWNHRSLDAYVRDLAGGVPPIAARESLTDEQLSLESLYLGLRTRRGIHLETYETVYGHDLLREKGRFLAQLIEDGLLEISEGYLRPSLRGMAVADSLALI